MKPNINHPAAIAIIGVMAALLLALGGCSKEEMESFVKTNMHPEFNVNYADEGKIFVLINQCLEYPETKDYRTCTLKQPWGPTDPAEIGVTVLEFKPNEVDKVLPYAREYQWITVNPSFSSLGGAVVMASTQLKIMGWRGVVLVYLPQGPDATRVDYSDYDSRWKEANRYMCGGWEQDFPIFQTALGALVRGVTEPDPKQSQIPKTLTVSGYSYSSHQVLEVIKDNPNVFFLDVAPSFGMQQWRGRRDHDIVGHNCNPYSKTESYHELDFEKYPNPHVATYIDNLATSRVPQCILDSFGDCTSLNFRGMTMTMNTELDIGCKDVPPPPDIVMQWDPMNPASTAYKLQPVHVTSGTTFLCADPAQWSDDACWTSTTSTHRYGVDERIQRAIIANMQTYDTIRIQTVQTPFAALDETWEKRLTSTFGESAYIGHFGYWMNGAPPDLTVIPPNIEETQANWHIRPFIQLCTKAFEPGQCSACPDADDWSNGDNPKAGTEIYWNQDPRSDVSPPQDHPENAVKDNDVIYIPIRSALPEGSGLAQAKAELSDKWGPALTAESGHVSATRNEATVLFRTIPPAARQVGQIVLYEDDIPCGVTGGQCTAPTPNTIHRWAWLADRLLSAGHIYSDLVGAWFDIGAYWWDDTLDPSDCGKFDLAYSGTRRVLAMKLDVSSTPKEGDFVRAYRAPVPDVRDTAIPKLTACSEDSVTTQIYVHPASTIDTVKGILTTPSGDTVLTGVKSWETCVDGDCAKFGTNMGYDFSLDARDIWCGKYPDDQLCGGRAVHDASLPLTFRVQPSNTEGNHFFRDYTLVIERGKDRDGDGIPDACDRCPDENSSRHDVDRDGCIDTLGGLRRLLDDLRDAGRIDPSIMTGLVKKLDDALKSFEEGNVKATRQQLNAFSKEVRTHKNKGIERTAADLLVAYVRSVTPAAR